MGPFSKRLDSTEIHDLAGLVRDRFGSDGEAAAFEAAAPLLRSAKKQQDAAQALVELTLESLFSSGDSADALLTALHNPEGDEALLLAVARGLEHARNINYLNAPAPDHALFRDAETVFGDRAGNATSEEEEVLWLDALASAARLRGRVGDQTAEAAFVRRIKLLPEAWGPHYDYGLFLKTRGRFEEGMRANQEAARLGGGEEESVLWNLGICATGAQEARVAFDTWTRLGQKLTQEGDQLPEGTYPDTKVRLAQRPLAERGVEDDDPGGEETIWIERLSGAHGIVRSVLYNDLGVDYGDVVLFDGAPITYHQVGADRVPVFPHLATLQRRHYQLYNFAATQAEPRQAGDLSAELPADAVVYSHTEQFVVLCRTCWEKGSSGHERHDEHEVGVVAGQIAAPPEVAPQQLLSRLEAAVAATEGVKVFCPGLLETAGELDRVEEAALRYEALVADL